MLSPEKKTVRSKYMMVFYCSIYEWSFAGANQKDHPCPASLKPSRTDLKREVSLVRLNGCPAVLWTDPESSDARHACGRRIALVNKTPAAQSKHRCLSLALAGVRSESALIASREVIVCKALIDALTFWCAACRNVIAAFGANALPSC